MKAIDLLLSSIIPPDAYQPGELLDKKGYNALAARLAKSPERYGPVMKELSDLGRNSAYFRGETLSLDDMRSPVDKPAMFAALDGAIAQARQTAKSDAEFKSKRDNIWDEFLVQLDKEVMKQSVAKGNNLGRAVASGARGSNLQLRAMIATPGLYTDYKGKVIPLFSRKSYGEGLRPANYLASTFGVRSSIISTKVSTAKGGDYLKQLNQSASDQVVTEKDCGTTNGLSVGLDDPDLIGRTLARPVAGHAAGTAIDRHVLKDLRSAKLSNVLARSPITCTAPQGLCSHCLGLRTDGTLAPVGYHAGITAAQAVGEPITQNALNAKHTSGAAKGGKRRYGGFEVLSALVQSPEAFPHKATAASLPGRIDNIEPAPQGGTFITVAGTKHYALPGYDPLVKVGDDVEAGDQLSDGVMDTGEVVQYRGLGEGRRYYAARLQEAIQDSGMARPMKQNLEVLARAALNHVRVNDNDGYGDALPDDFISYNAAVKRYSPPKDAKVTPLNQVGGKYLQEPALHFSIGTKLTPRMVKELKDASFGDVTVSDTPPPFSPEMVRLRTAAHAGKDWLAKLNTSYIGSNLEHDAERGFTTNLKHNINFAPRIAVGEGFGKNVGKKGEF